MAQQPDNFLPFTDLTQFVPQYLRNNVNMALLSNLFNRFMTKDETVPLFGFIGRKSADSEDRSVRVPQSSAERDINAVTPVLTFLEGTERVAYTVQDLLNRARTLGIDTNDLAWLYSQGNNFLPPIDLDKFVNYFRYYWVARGLPSVVNSPVTDKPKRWNPELAAEYYVIAPPALTDSNKLNVATASAPGENYVLTGSGFLDQSFIVNFTTATDFTVTTTAPLFGPLSDVFTPYVPVQTFWSLSPTPTIPQAVPVDLVDTIEFNVSGPAGTFKLVEFRIIREPIFDAFTNVHIGYTGFAAGDELTIDTTFLSTNYSVTFTGALNPLKGKIAFVRALNEYQSINGWQLSKGDRVLIKNQLNGAENGIYIVSEQTWQRAPDFDVNTWAAGARVFVRHGAQANSLWESTQVMPTQFAWNLVSSNTFSNTNDWQEGNFWVKDTDLAALGLSASQVIQGQRPIIEFQSGIQLNSRVVNGLPTEGVPNYNQQKSEFNQLPLFDLFRYDGTHSGLVSSLFYYVEDLTADLDVALQKRIKRTNDQSADAIFNHGCMGNDGHLLFFKNNGQLGSVWHPGHLSPTVDIAYISTGNGTITVTPSNTTLPALWTLRALTPTSFSVQTSRTAQLPPPFNVATVGVPYNNGEIAFTISAGLVPFAVDDTILIRVGNLERPRYVYRASDESIQDFFGGPSADTNNVGAYAVPRTFIHNPYNSVRDEISEGAALMHFRGILAAQSPYLPVDFSFGGIIKLWSEQHTLLASLLMQRDLTLTSLIDMAKRHYENGLNAVRDIYLKHVIDYFSTEEVANADNPAELARLLDWILQLRTRDNDARTVLFDTTSGVTGIPITLPQMGLAPLTVPGYQFDLVLDQQVLIHHDGHRSSLLVDSQELRDLILGNYIGRFVSRSDGTSTAAVGSFTATPPSMPYKGELWLRPTGGNLSDILAFDVDYDTATPPPVSQAGKTWYQRGSNTLFLSNGFSWVPQPDPTAAWRQINFADTINELLILIEQRLYAACNPTQRQYDFSLTINDTVFKQELQRELSNFAALNGLDPLATDYDAFNAFTWNYSQSLVSSFAPLSTPSVPARWHKALIAHQQTVVGVIPTERPDIEPWKLFGFPTYTAWWSSLTPIQQASYTPFASQLDGTFIYGGEVRAVDTTFSISPLSGLPVVDGVALATGDRVLLQNQAASANNGIWIVGLGSWTRAATPLVFKTYVTVMQGEQWASTTWALTATVNLVNVDPVEFSQVRSWTFQMWSDLQTLYPSLRLSVSPFNGALLPPYVSNTLATAPYALTTTLPTGITLPYEFGEGSPVEEAWVRSVEYPYALVKALARYDPLALLGFAWGFNWVEVNGVLYDGYDMSIPGHLRFHLHGDAITPTTNGQLILSSISSPAGCDLTLRYDAYDTARRQSFSVRDTATSQLLAVVVEGITTTVVAGATTLNNLHIEDNGVPFKLGDAFRITCLPGGVNLVVQFIPATYHRIHGLGQTFTNALREISANSGGSYAQLAFKGWEARMGYRAGGMVATDDLLIATENDSLSTASYELILKRNDFASDIWLHALRVVVVQLGSAPDASDWVYRIEGYNPRMTQISYYELDAPPAGMAFPLIAVTGDRFFRHDLGSLYEFNGTDWVAITQGVMTFNVLDKSDTALVWMQPTNVVDAFTVNLPITIVGLQNVVTFLFGYSKYAIDIGWRLNNGHEFKVDEETGRHIDWQLEIEKTIRATYKASDIGAANIVNPFMDEVWVHHPKGLLSAFSDSALFDITGDPGVFDLAGVKMPVRDITVIRGSTLSRISATAPMHSVHAQTSEYEHLFIFKNFIDEASNFGQLYEPFTGSRVVTYRFNGRQQGIRNFRPEMGGYYIAGNRARLNLQASTDELERLYDPLYAFENALSSRHATALLGYSQRTTGKYLDPLETTHKTQFNFWRGLIHSKGTNLSIDAYLNNNRFKQVFIDEYWAYKLAEYGDARQKKFPELRLRVEDCFQQVTQLQFDALPGLELTNFQQISRFDETRWFSIEDLDQDAFFKAEQVGTFTRVITPADDISQGIMLPFVADLLVISGPAIVLNQTAVKATGVGTITVIGWSAAPDRYSPIKLINYADDQSVEDIPYWHPAANYHTPLALENINTIGTRNPARYNQATVVTGNVTYDPLRPWGEKEVGRVWFDTRRLAYVPYYDPSIFSNLAERLSRWGALADYASIDVYEWVKSSVPPSEYNALAATEALNADLTGDDKASGEVALVEIFQRDRIWFIRPIAWSQTGTTAGGHPSFTGSYNSKLLLFGNIYVLELGTFAERGITAGSRIGAWRYDPFTPQPLSEAEVLDDFRKWFDFNGSTQQAGLSLEMSQVFSGIGTTISVSMSKHTDLTGQIVVSASTDGPIARVDPDAVTIGYDYFFNLTLSSVETGRSETVRVSTAFTTTLGVPTISVVPSQTFEANFDGFGIRISLTVDTAGSALADTFTTGIATTLFDYITVQDAATMREIIVGELPFLSVPILSNEPHAAYSAIQTNPMNGPITITRTDSVVENTVSVYINGVKQLPSTYTVSPTSITVNSVDFNRKVYVVLEGELANSTSIGWVSWTVPTQAQLDTDGAQPFSVWKPYVGEYSLLMAPSTLQLNDAVEYEAQPLKLNDGTKISRYRTEWADWEQTTDTVYSRAQTVLSGGPITITHTEVIPVQRTTVYVNGLVQLKSAYSILGDTITVTSVPFGNTVHVIIRRYEPTADELKFSPETADNLRIQRQYKQDYQYVKQEVRQLDGTASKPIYYFWVKNRQVIARGKKLSVQAIAQQLRTGPQHFMTFQTAPGGMLGDGTTSNPYRYDAITVSGLTYTVTRNDTFKLRFTRNFTLRDEPRELDLKNVHTEWALIRPGQRSRVPEQLWNKLMDSAAGADAAGNSIPSLRRVLYDERNGTKTQFGFGIEQTLAPANLLRFSLAYTVVNTTLRKDTPLGPIPDWIQFIDAVVNIQELVEYNDSAQLQQAKDDKVRAVYEAFFSTPELVRQTLSSVWTSATIAQLNELFFSALEDMLASNLELTDIFKTSRLSAYSIRIVNPAVTAPSYE